MALQWQERLGDLGLQQQPSLPMEHLPGPLIHNGKVRTTGYCFINAVIVHVFLGCFLA